MRRGHPELCLPALLFLRLCLCVSLQLPLVIYVRPATSGVSRTVVQRERSRQMTYGLIISSAKCPIAMRNSDGWPSLYGL
jgi:hypothetical protein